MARTSSSESIIVNASVEDAFALLADINAHPALFDNQVRDYNGGAVVSTHDEWTTAQVFMGREIITAWTLTDINAPDRIVFSGTSDATDITVEWLFEEVSGGTQITSNSEGESKGFFAIVASALLQGNFRQYVRENLERIKAQLES